MSSLIENTTVRNKSSLSLSLITIIAIALFCVVFGDFWKNWKKEKTPFVWDVKQYYVYLPATFIHNDLTFKKNTDLWMNVMPNGNRVPRATYGMSLMYMPSFLLGYKMALNTKEPLTGYSKSFIDAIHYGVFFYLILSLLFLRSILLRYFRESVASITIALTFFGTNYFFYTLSDGEMPHSYLFFLFTVFLWLTIKWHESHKYIHSVLLGALIALIALIRPTEIIVTIVFVFYGIHNKASFKEAILNYKKHFLKLIIMLIGFIVVLMPQLIYWKMQTGKFFFFSYGDQERFFFNDPKIIDVLFGYRKGWLLYTPMIVFSIIGFFYAKRYIPKFNNLILIYITITLCLISTWWCWWFGGGFGMRAMVQSYVFLAFPLASFIDSVLFSQHLHRLFKYITISAIAFFLYLNLLQNYQYINGIIHWDAMNKKSYWIVFGKYQLSGEENHDFWGSMVETDYEGARKGKR